MRQAARLLARFAQAPQPVREAPAAPKAVNPGADAFDDLLDCLDLQVVTLDELVSATQAQVRALIALKATDVGDSETMRDLGSAQARVSELSTRLGQNADSTLEAAAILQRELGLGGPALKLSELLPVLTASQRRPLDERLSSLRSIGQALQELQRVAQVHAHRGLQAVAAWRTILGVPQQEAGPTYSRTGRPWVRPTLPATSVDIDL